MERRKVVLFQKTFAATNSMAAAARAAELPLDEARRLRDQLRAEPQAQAELDELGLAVAALESEAVRRALTGVEVPVFHQGRECGATVKHSDQLLMFLLKTLKPSRYAGVKDASPTGPGRAVELVIDLSAADDDDTPNEPE